MRTNVKQKNHRKNYGYGIIKSNKGNIEHQTDKIGAAMAKLVF